MERGQSLSYNPPVWGSGLVFPWPHPVLPNLPIPHPSSPSVFLLILSPTVPFLAPSHTSHSLPPSHPPSYLSPYLSAPVHLLLHFSSPTLPSGADAAQEDVPLRVYQEGGLNCLDFSSFTPCRPTPPKALQVGQGTPELLTQYLLLFTCHNFEERASPQTCDGSVSTCLSKNGTQTHRGGFAP